MEKSRKMLLTALFKAGSIPRNDIIESQKSFTEMIEEGLVEIVRPEGQLPYGGPLCYQFRLTSRGKAVAEVLTRR
jgi:hypothetical protein